MAMMYLVNSKNKPKRITKQAERYRLAFILSLVLNVLLIAYITIY